MKFARAGAIRRPRSRAIPNLTPHLARNHGGPLVQSSEKIAIAASADTPQPIGPKLRYQIAAVDGLAAMVDAAKLGEPSLTHGVDYGIVMPGNFDHTARRNLQVVTCLQMQAHPAKMSWRSEVARRPILLAQTTGNRHRRIGLAVWRSFVRQQLAQHRRIARQQRALFGPEPVTQFRQRRSVRRCLGSQQQVYAGGF